MHENEEILVERGGSARPDATPGSANEPISCDLKKSQSELHSVNRVLHIS